MNGKIISVTSDIIEILWNDEEVPAIGTLLKVNNSDIILSTEIIHKNRYIKAIRITTGSKPIIIGEEVTSTNKPLQAPVGRGALGRVYNVLGQTIDNLEINNQIKYKDVEIKFDSAKKDFTSKSDFLWTGIKIIDFFCPTRKGDKIGIFGGAGVGKTVVIKEIINNTTFKNKSDQNINPIMVGIGERSREGEELYREIKEANLLNSVMLFFAQMNETPGARMKIIYSAITSAEYFRDELKEDTIMFIDNIYRYIQAGSELSSSLGNMPSEAGYQPTLFTDISNVQERLINSDHASITSFQTVFVPADDITDPSIVNIFSYLDSSLVLNREIASEGRFPAVDVLKTSSQNTQKGIVSTQHLKALIKSKKIIQRLSDLEYIIAILGRDGLSKEDLQTVIRAKLLLNFFTQDMFVAESFTQKPGVWVKLEDTLESIEIILSGQLDEIDPHELLYVGSAMPILEKLRVDQIKKNIIKQKKINASKKSQKISKKSSTKNK